MTLLRDDAELLAAFRRGDRAALERVYWHYVSSVVTVIRHGATASQGTRVLAATPDDQVDLVQETFLRAFKKNARLAYDGRRPYQPYILTICRNVLVDWTRRHLRDKIRRETPQPVSTDAPLSPEASWADAHTIRAVDAYIAQLPPKLKSVYDARYVQGLSQVETGATLGLTRQQVRTLENDLRAGLAAWLG